MPQAATGCKQGACVASKPVSSLGYHLAVRVSLMQNRAACICLAALLLFLIDQGIKLSL